MNRPLSVVLDALRPGRVEAREAANRVRDDVRELRRAIRHIEERGARNKEFEDKITQALEGIKAQVGDLARDLRTLGENVAGLSAREAQLRAVLMRDAALEDQEPMLASLLTQAGTAEHVTAAVEAAGLQLDPFPHIVVDNLLPDSIYDALITGLPPAELFGARRADKQQIKVPFQLGPAYARRMWRFMAHVIAPQFITPVVVEKFREPLVAWIRENWPSVGEDQLRNAVRLHTSDGRIMLRRRGYCIPPHRDPKWGFLTCLIYLVRPDDQEAWGTQLYSVASDREAQTVAPHWIDASTCTLVKDVAFRRNRALVFLNSVGAHGASIPADAEPADLERYLYQFRIGPSGGAIRELIDTLPPERRQAWSGKFADY